MMIALLALIISLINLIFYILAYLKNKSKLVATIFRTESRYPNVQTFIIEIVNTGQRSDIVKDLKIINKNKQVKTIIQNITINENEVKIITLESSFDEIRRVKEMYIINGLGKKYKVKQLANNFKVFR
jgi:hypothetical protein